MKIIFPKLIPIDFQCWYNEIVCGVATLVYMCLCRKVGCSNPYTNVLCIMSLACCFPLLVIYSLFTCADTRLSSHMHAHKYSQLKYKRTCMHINPCICVASFVTWRKPVVRGASGSSHPATYVAATVCVSMATITTCKSEEMRQMKIAFKTRVLLRSNLLVTVNLLLATA